MRRKKKKKKPTTETKSGQPSQIQQTKQKTPKKKGTQKDISPNPQPIFLLVHQQQQQQLLLLLLLPPPPPPPLPKVINQTR
jgi:hypothetical protein